MDAKTLKALGLIASQLAAASTALAQILNADDGDPSPTGTKKPAVKMGWSAKQLKMLEEKATELVEDAGLDRKAAAARAVAWMEKKGEKRATPVNSAPAAVQEKRGPGRPKMKREDDDVPAAPVKKPTAVKIKMLTLEEMRDGTAPTLAQFSASLVDAGIERGSEKFEELKAKFLELRKKFKAQIEEEADVQDADDLTAEYVIGEGDPDSVTFSEEEEEEEPAPKKAPRVTVKKEKDAFQFD
jgi:hypothetical protein